jgi:hypothetical protein
MTSWHKYRLLLYAYEQTVTIVRKWPKVIERMKFVTDQRQHPHRRQNPSHESSLILVGVTRTLLGNQLEP